MGFFSCAFRFNSKLETRNSKLSPSTFAPTRTPLIIAAHPRGPDALLDPFAQQPAPRAPRDASRHHSGPSSARAAGGLADADRPHRSGARRGVAASHGA